MIDFPRNVFAFVIDTTEYAGNFERPMCAYLTGQIAECGVGREIADEVKNDIAHLSWWQENTAYLTDERGTQRPTSIFSTPNWFNNGFGRHFVDAPENYDEAHMAAIASAKEYNEPLEAKILDRLNRDVFEADNPGAWTKEACLRELNHRKAFLQRIIDEPTRHPAYLSVAIFTQRALPRHVFDETVRRARSFHDFTVNSASPYMIKFKGPITGFRQLKFNDTEQTLLAQYSADGLTQ